MSNKELRGEAYAEFDTTTRILRIFRDEPGKYEDDQTDGTKTYCMGIEDIEGDSEPKWHNPTIIRRVVIEDTFKPKTAYCLFDGMDNLTEIEGMENLDTSECTDMYGMFNGCKNLKELDVSNLDTSKVIDMTFMFLNCKSLIELDLSNFDTSDVRFMGGMFNRCENLKELDLSGFDTSNVIDMGMMFNGCKNLVNLDVSHFDTSKVTIINDMFRNCSNLTELNLSRWDTSKVINTDEMFWGCDDIQTVYVSDTNESLMKNLLRSNSDVEVKIKDNHHFIAGDDGYIERAEGAKRNPSPSTKDSDHYFTADYNGDKGWNIKEFDAEGNEVSKSKKENPQKTFSETKAEVLDEIDKIINDLIAMKNKYVSSNDADSFIEAHARGNDEVVDMEGR